MTYIQYKNYVQDKNKLYKEFKDMLYKNIPSCKFNQHWSYCIQQKVTIKTSFKIHLSATIQNANLVAELFFKYITKRNMAINYKIVSSLEKLELQNSGAYGYSQIGKFITIYPNNNNELLFLLDDLNNIFKGIKSIKIPSDFQYKLSEVVFYRYGEFIIDDSFKDTRNQEIPKNVKIPIPDFFINRYYKIPDRFILLDVITKNAKGGVYKALDTQLNKIVILKEASNLSNIDIFNRDSIDRLMLEKSILTKISKENFSPKILGEFYVEDSYFLELEYIQSKPLSEVVSSIPVKIWFNKLVACIEMLNLKYNISYRDLSFNNILLTSQNKIYIIDFEFALDKQIFLEYDSISLYGTPGFYETDLSMQSTQPEDIFGLVSLLYWNENFLHYQEFQKLDYETALKKAANLKLNNQSPFFPIYSKAFTHSYATFHDLKQDIENIF
jgi:predicted Ser/Thr protein kinase